MTRPKFYDKNMEDLSKEVEELKKKVEFLNAALRVTRRQRDEMEKALNKRGHGSDEEGRCNRCGAKVYP